MNFGPASVCQSVIFFMFSTSSQELRDFFCETDVTEQSRKNDEDGVPCI